MPVIQVAALEPHPALRTGIEVIVGADPHLSFAGAAGGERALWHLLRNKQPDVLPLDHPHHARAFQLCLRIKARPRNPGIVIYTANAGSATVSARLAGGDALVDKAGDVQALVKDIRGVAAGEHRLPRISQRM